MKQHQLRLAQAKQAQQNFNADIITQLEGLIKQASRGEINFQEMQVTNMMDAE